MLARAAVCAAAGCGGSPSPEPQESPGGVVDVLGLWSGPELDAFLTVEGRWEDATGHRLDWHGAQDVARDLARRLDAGDPPDVAVLPNPGLLHDLADDGALLPLEPVVGADRLARDYPATGVPPETYPDVVSRRLADTLVSAPTVRFGAGDAMPSVVQRAWWQAMLAYAEDPRTLDARLALLTTTAAAAR